jgi:hypothetical protein
MTLRAATATREWLRHAQLLNQPCTWATPDVPSCSSGESASNIHSLALVASGDEAGFPVVSVVHGRLVTSRTKAKSGMPRPLLLAPRADSGYGTTRVASALDGRGK